MPICLERSTVWAADVDDFVKLKVYFQDLELVKLNLTVLLIHLAAQLDRSEREKEAISKHSLFLAFYFL